jgi:hypothetical protein
MTYLIVAFRNFSHVPKCTEQKSNVVSPSTTHTAHTFTLLEYPLLDRKTSETKCENIACCMGDLSDTRTGI